MKELQSAGGNKIKGKPKPVIQEEECIIDKLLKEIKQGFQLKKRRISSPILQGKQHLSDQNKKMSKSLSPGKNMLSDQSLKQIPKQIGKLIEILICAMHSLKTCCFYDGSYFCKT